MKREGCWKGACLQRFWGVHRRWIEVLEIWALGEAGVSGKAKQMAGLANFVAGASARLVSIGNRLDLRRRFDHMARMADTQVRCYFRDARGLIDLCYLVHTIKRD